MILATTVALLSQIVKGKSFIVALSPISIKQLSATGVISCGEEGKRVSKYHLVTRRSGSLSCHIEYGK